MAEKEHREELREKIMRYRKLEDETTDPLATRLLREILSDLEADLNKGAKQQSREETLFRSVSGVQGALRTRPQLAASPIILRIRPNVARDLARLGPFIRMPHPVILKAQKTYIF